MSSFALLAIAYLVDLSGGALFIGAMASMVIYGITTLQVYSSNYILNNQDRLTTSVILLLSDFSKRCCSHKSSGEPLEIGIIT